MARRFLRGFLHGICRCDGVGCDTKGGELFWDGLMLLIVLISFGVLVWLLLQLFNNVYESLWYALSLDRRREERVNLNGVTFSFVKASLLLFWSMDPSHYSLQVKVLLFVNCFGICARLPNKIIQWTV